MRIFNLLIALFVTLSLTAQVVTTNPAFPTVTDEISVYFNADQGNQGLKDYTGDVYAHAGLITSKSSGGSDWKYVITDWNENTSKNKMERVSANQYKLTISPNILDFYEVAAGEEVLQMAFVFRNADGSLTGKTEAGADIFVDVYNNVINVKVESPQNNSIITLNDTVIISVSSNLATTTTLFINDTEIETTATNSIEYKWPAKEKGNYTIKAKASDGTLTVYDSVQVLVFDETPEAELPDNVQNGINIHEDGSVTFVLHAPEKETVILKGDMSNWLLKEEYIMNRNPEGTHFWLTVNGLNPDYEYAYQFVIDGSITIADPYTEKVLDPWNDQYIEEETYPNLKAYPEGKTSEIVSTFLINEPSYQWAIDDFTPPAKTDLVIYELHVRDFVEAHSYKTLADTIAYLKNLGVNVVELMPVNEFEGNDSWGYNPSFYFALDKYYGTKNDLKRFVDTCHANGIAVFTDLVLNHSYGQSPFARMYLDGGKPADNNPWYNRDNNFTNPDAQWGYDFNHESIHTQNLVDSINSYWMNEYRIDGFRFDFTKGFGNNIKGSSDSWGSLYDADRIRLLKRMADEIWERKPGAFVCFEHLAENSEEKVLANHGILLWGNMNHNYAEGAMGYNTSNKSNYNYGTYQYKGWDQPNLITYMESHDEERVQYKNTQWGAKSEDESYDITNDTIGWKRLELNANFFLTIPGPKMIWQFGEVGYDYNIDYNGRVGKKPIRWDYMENNRRKRVYDVYAVLNDIRVNMPVFETENFKMDANGDVKRITLYHESMDVFVIGNFDVEKQKIEAEFPHTGTWYELYSQTSVSVSDSLMELSLQPGEYRLYSTGKIEHKSLPEYEWSLSLATPIEGTVEVYPVPSNDFISIKNYEDATQISIYHISGDHCMDLDKDEITQQIQISHLKSGMYIVRIKNSKGELVSGRFMRQ
jgi:1,4-alpha-glucan branching enzyme